MEHLACLEVVVAGGAPEEVNLVICTFEQITMR